MIPPMPLDVPLVHRARELARVAHADHVRKSGQVPYFTHLDAVARLLAEHGYEDETTLAAAYLHDLVEDRPAFTDEMVRQMPEEVVATVHALTEQKRDAHGQWRTKEARVAGYVERLSRGDAAARRALPISCADKIHNTLSIVDSLRRGEPLLIRLSTRPGEHDAQLATLRALYAPATTASLLAAFDDAREALLTAIEAWLPSRAAHLAAEAHLGQLQRDGSPYILHPMHLMARARGPAAQMVAALHDVVEDTACTLETLRREGFPERVIAAVDAMTHREGETYETYIERVAADRLATQVKLLDLEHNSDLSRIPSPTPDDHARMQRYARATARLIHEQSKRSVWIRLSSESAERVAAEARHPIVRGDHVTLARRVAPGDLTDALLPEGCALGETVSLVARAEHLDERLQAWAVELAGSTRRPSDDGTLHVTVSRTRGARSRESNALLERPAARAIEVPLEGVVTWVDR